MNRSESSVFSRFFGSAFAYISGNASQEVMNAAEAEAAQVQATIEGLNGQITTLAAERDGFQTKVTSLTSERDTLKTEAEQLRTWKANHSKTTQAIIPGQDQNQTGDDILSKFPEGSLMRTALEAITSKGTKK
ncbi:hypothetical protein [Runella sp.]|uniref:hypothetical protein n=1 Tax=Runella sp. TaxID=1960881 RepID=UPI003D10DC72